MKIIAHRGFWQKESEKNTLLALRRALDNGFGIETDLRDYCGKLVISHNISDDKSPLAEDIFNYYETIKSKAVLALNVKADGIQVLLKPLLEKYQILNYFLFDMSIPELVVNVKEKLKFYTRHSDIENECVMYDKACGVWVDSFYCNRWLSIDKIKSHLDSGKSVCIVSPELHSNDYKAVWELIKKENLHNNIHLSLCTDLPMIAREYFNE